jgi:hypothetical protein
MNGLSAIGSDPGIWAPAALSLLVKVAVFYGLRY